MVGEFAHEARGAAPNDGIEAKQCSAIGPIASILDYYIATDSVDAKQSSRSIASKVVRRRYPVIDARKL